MANKLRKSAFLLFERVPLNFDVVVTEKVEHRADVTEHPVEIGAPVADNIRHIPTTITLDCIVSNAPLADVNKVLGLSVAGVELVVEKKEKPLVPTPGALMMAAIDAIKSALSGPETWKAIVLLNEEYVNHCAFVLGTLLDWKERGVIGQVIMGDRTYPSMAITDVNTQRTGTTGDALEFSLGLKEIRIVETKLVTIPIPSEPRAAVAKNKGRQPTSFVRDAGPKKSFFAAGRDSLRR